MDTQEQKLINIKPLPTEEEKEKIKKMTRKKPGRKPNPNKKKPTGEKHIMTEARKQALLKARLARAEKRKAQKEEIKEIKQPESTGQIPVNVMSRIGKLEETLGGINERLLGLLKVGTFKSSNQADQTVPQIPTELNQADITKPEDSFLNRTNGGVSREKVRPDDLNKEILPPNLHFKGPSDFLF